MKIGIIQGRLSKPTNGFQDTPEKWLLEFKKLKKLGLNHIEWVVTTKSFSNNPIFIEDVKNLPISSICADNVVSNLIDNYRFLIHNLSPICNAALKNNIKYVTVPLLEDSSLECQYKLDKFCKSFTRICKKYPDIIFSLETELPVNQVSKLLNIADNISLTYDTGNSTSYGIDHEYYINCFINVISNVHLKDRTFSGKTVPPTTGDTDFTKIFRLLKEYKYNNIYTLQTSRESIGSEEETINKHYNLLKEIYEK